MLLRCFLITFVSVILGACAYNDHFDNRINRYDIAAEQARDAMVLTNIVRASHAEPMSFLQLGKISGSNTSTATAGLPSVLFGPLSAVAATATLQKEVIFGASAGGGGNGYVGNSASTSGSVNFEASTAETKDFYRGLLTEVDPRTLQFFIQQGVSRELLFYLFTDKLIEVRNGQTRELRNDPLSPDFPKFQHAVQLAMDFGLSSEPIAGRASVKEKSKKTSSGHDTQSIDLSQDWQICFNKTYIQKPIDTTYLEPICGTKHISDDRHSVSFRGSSGEQVKLSVLPRSPFAIFQFLGRILAAGEQGRIRLHSDEAIDNGPMRDDYLFTVETGPVVGCFLSILYESQNYCVPLEGSANTKRILSLLTQLIALNTSIEDVPLTPTVRLIQ
jgi:hypothetical protein